ncbi:MAG: DUF2147 domain-containing protein [Gammaproteobacteria bacterium]|nr:DUF2147 domain-containing protein [Gammaproteobacteria bacterium]
MDGYGTAGLQGGFPAGGSGAGCERDISCLGVGVVDHEDTGVKSPVGKPRLDIHNTDSSLRGRPIQGLTIATGLHYERGRWRGGRIYNPASGKTYRCEMELAADGYLEVRGYIGIAALGRTLYWQRLENFRDTVTAMLGSVPKPV